MKTNTTNNKNNKSTKNSSNTKRSGKAGTILPIILGVLVIAAIVGGVLFFAHQSQLPPSRGGEPADDGELIDYEKEGTITQLGDYHAISSLVSKDDLSEENTDDPVGLVWDEYLKTCKIKKYPKDLLDEATLDAQKQFEDFAEASGMSTEELAASYNLNDDTVEENAKDAVKSRLVAKTIALRENMTMSDDQLKSYLNKITEEDDNKASTEQVIKAYVEGTSVRPRDDAYVEMVKEYLLKQVQ